MRPAPYVVAIVVLLGACSDQPAPQARTAQESRLFGPVSMHLDNFSKVRDWTGHGAPDGVEALVEFDDAFADRTKAAGTIVFELFDYRRGWPDSRGLRLVNPFSASLLSYDEQKAHWERASGAYMFRLACDGLTPYHSYVLTASFEPTGGGGRLFSQIILAAQAPPPTSRESHAPATRPTSRFGQP
ncbi:MAG: hypothetical protein ABR964_02355 [Tepidisphaeraceae bacterium]|jgi:hypothetical protein